MKAQCRSCSFNEIKKIKECVSSGYITITECIHVNTKNENDKFKILNYETCSFESLNFLNAEYIFIFIILVLFIFFIYKLSEHRNKL